MLTETQAIFNRLEELQQEKLKKLESYNRFEELKSPKVIKYYLRNDFGNILEFVNPDHNADGKIIYQLINKRCLTPIILEIIRDL